jgi:hypothetical protein
MAMLRKIPPKIAMKLKTIKTPSVVVGAGLLIPEKEILDNKWTHLGIVAIDGKINFPTIPIYPDPYRGYVSNQNVNGKEIIHKDRPKVRKDIYVGDRPVYGDWSKGSFSLWQTRKVYQKTFLQPNGLSFLIKEIVCDVPGYRNIVITMIPPLEKAEADFEISLIFALSLLNELIGIYDIYKSDITAKEILETRKVNWEIFPPGERDFKSELVRKLIGANAKNKKEMLHRADVIEKMHPKQFVMGSGLNSNYYGALFESDLVVFENIEYGNATYILFEDWEEVSKKSRTEIMKGKSNYERIIHDENWENEVKEIIKHELIKRRIRRR